MRLTVSHVIALVCWLCLATLPIWWLTGGYDPRQVTAGVFWIVGGVLASLNTLEVRKARKDK